MADNVILSEGSLDGATVAAASLSISGDTAVVQMIGNGILEGSEGSWAYYPLVDGAGAVGNGVQRMTLASDDPAVALLGTIDTDTGNIATAVQIIDNAVYVDDADWTDSTSSHMLVGGLYQSSPQTITDGDVGPFQVTSNGYLITTLGAALPAGTNAIGKLAANSGVDIGDVDVISIVPGFGATNLGKREDDGHSSGDVGIMALSVRSDVPAATAGASGDYQPIFTNASGYLYVIDSSTLVDDAAFTPGTSRVGVIGAQADETAADSVDEGDAGALRMTLDRHLRVDSVQENAMFDAGTYCAIKRFALTPASSGENTLVTAVAAKKIRLLSIAIFATSGTAVSFYLNNASDGGILGDSTDKITIDLDGSGGSSGFVLNHNPGGWAQTGTANEDLRINLSSATAVVVNGTYIEVA